MASVAAALGDCAAPANPLQSRQLGQREEGDDPGLLGGVDLEQIAKLQALL